DDAGESVLDRLQIVRRVRDRKSGFGLVGAASGLTIARQEGVPESVAPTIDCAGRCQISATGADGEQHLNVVAASRSRVGFLFDPPRSYPMPPPEAIAKNDGTLRFASADVGQQGDGYIFDTGNLNSVVLTSLKFAPDGSTFGPIQINRQGFSPVKPNETLDLGDASVHPLYALADPLDGQRTAWLLPLLGLAAGWLLCSASVIRLKLFSKRAPRPLRNVAPISAAFVLWVVAATLLTVRVILAYRVSLSPPFNMNASAAESYRTCWAKAVFAAVIVPPLLALGVLVISRLQDRSQGREAPSWLDYPTLQRTADGCYMLALGTATLEALHKLLHLFPFPSTALYGVGLVVIGMVFQGVAESFRGPEQPSLRNSRLQRVRWLTPLLLLFNDPGTVIFLVPLCFAMLAAGFVKSLDGDSRPYRAKVGTGLVCVSIVLGILFSPSIGGKLLVSRLAAPLVHASAFPYRFVATDADAAQELMVNPAAKYGRFRPLEMERALLQRWQMKAYVKGAGSGYFRAPLSNAGMTYATMLSDAAFSVFLVGEHGKTVGLCTITMLLLLALALFATAWRQSQAREGREHVRALFAISGIVGTGGVYMGLGNLWAAPFTGENVPLLSLDSYKDLALNVSLLLAALVLIALSASTAAERDMQVRRQAAKFAAWWWAFPGLLVIGWAILGYRLYTTDGDPAQPFNFSPKVLDQLAAVSSGIEKEAGQKHTAARYTYAYQRASAFVQTAVANYEAGASTQTPLLPGHGRSEVLVDHSFYSVRSPFQVDPGVPWHGSLVAVSASNRRRLFLNGVREPIELQKGAPPAVVVLGQRVKATVAQSIDLEQPSARYGRIDYGGIKLVGDKLMFRWRTAGKPGTITIDGLEPNLEQNEVELVPNDVITLTYPGQDGLEQSFTILYTGPSDSNLATVSWRNGHYTRSFPQGADFPLARSIAEAVDDSKPKAGNVAVSLDLDLQRKLQAELRGWAEERSRPVTGGARKPDGLPFTAVSILDSHTGQIRALAAVPQVSPDEDFQQVRNRFSNDRDALVASRSSWDFVNRTIGSTVKPLSFAALCSQLDGKTFHLEDLKVDEQAAVEGDPPAYRKLGDIELKRGKLIGLKEVPRPQVDMFTYLRDSRTWPAIVTSTIGLVSDKSDPKLQRSELQSLLQPGNGPVWTDGARVAFRPREALSRVFVPGTKKLTLNSVELDQTAYFQGIQTCYGPNAVSFDFNDATRSDEGFLGAISLPYRDQGLKELVLPDLHVTDTTSLTDLDGQLLRYMIGAGECRWNALTMSVNAARLMTGKKVMATFGDPPQKVADMPWPISDFKGWREPHLLAPLQAITTIPAADAGAIRSAVASAGYRIAMKTGTIDDGAGKHSMESEMLMFTIGRWDESRGFVPGQSISGFLSIRSAKATNGEEMIKGDLARRIVPILVAYLRRLGPPTHR
ncbi:MAG TPA: hypothetical protein VG944_02105, partial [Fimbriimonas sp.]|nr:hypothetical protein [Fimbriimonas sp.]